MREVRAPFFIFAKMPHIVVTAVHISFKVIERNRDRVNKLCVSYVLRQADRTTLMRHILPLVTSNPDVFPESSLERLVTIIVPAFTAAITEKLYLEDMH